MHGLVKSFVKIHGLIKSIVNIHGLVESIVKVHGLVKWIVKVHGLVKWIVKVHGLIKSIVNICGLVKSIVKVHGLVKWIVKKTTVPHTRSSRLFPKFCLRFSDSSIIHLKSSKYSRNVWSMQHIYGCLGNQTNTGRLNKFNVPLHLLIFLKPASTSITARFALNVKTA